MSADEIQLSDGSPPEAAAYIGPFPNLLAEASRQLNICNACRYCEGLCAVFPALERRTVLDAGDLTQLANLCHDCRACYDACMYSPPHEFAIDIPLALSAVRVVDYDRYVWPQRVPRVFRGWMGLISGSLVSVALVLGLAVAHAGWSSLIPHPRHAVSPYRLIPYGELLALMLAAAAFGIAVMAGAGVRYWRQVGGAPDGLTWAAVRGAAWDAITLKYLRGGGDDCYYPEDEQPSPSRRRLHMMVAGGFCLCIVSTIAAAFAQDVFGDAPPYPWLSVPVLAGTIGGVSLVIGCAGLIGLKRHSSPVTSFADMTVKDYGLLVALAFLALTGLATLLTRDTPASGIVLLIHLSAVVESFAMAPYSKFIHVVFRSLALVRDHLERAA
jgi:citrate/tricarballylate utilization protein